MAEGCSLKMQNSSRGISNRGNHLISVIFCLLLAELLRYQGRNTARYFRHVHVQHLNACLVLEARSFQAL